ncbi:MAG: hypothetical protein ACU0BB_09755, partial [Paracoccaceae bacterium]
MTLQDLVRQFCEICRNSGRVALDALGMPPPLIYIFEILNSGNRNMTTTPDVHAAEPIPAEALESLQSLML